MSLRGAGYEARIRPVYDLGAATVVAITLWGETRSEPIEGTVAVGCVIRNRVRDARWPDTFQGVCLQRWQFSCWLPEGGEANFKRVWALYEEIRDATTRVTMRDQRYRQCEWVAQGIVNNYLADRVVGANHYYATTIPEPKWAKGQTPVLDVGLHRFYRL